MGPGTSLVFVFASHNLGYDVLEMLGHIAEAFKLITARWIASQCKGQLKQTPLCVFMHD